ncbi:MAG: amidohydrolase family protein [Deinococcales bacterium]
MTLLGLKLGPPIQGLWHISKGLTNMSAKKGLEFREAVRKMTSSVADRLGLRNRGLLRQGMQADLVLFDPECISDKATFADPHQLSVGVRDVWVNGVRVLKEGEHTGAMRAICEGVAGA